MNTHRTTCPHSNGRFETSDRGVFFIGKDQDGNERPPLWICSTLKITAQTRDDRNGEWGRLLEWCDGDGHEHQWVMPMHLLEGDGAEVRRELANKGLSIAPGLSARSHLIAYIKLWSVSERARCVERLGWHGDVFVTPTGTIGETQEKVVFLNNHAIEPAMTQAGTTRQWRESVARLAQGNSRLTFAICCAFAGPLAEIAGADSGGFHLRGSSSTGKSTALKAAASVWGNPRGYVRTWRLTTNGLEGLAVLHNDGILILDEISQVDPIAVGDAAYMLANGQGKVRANRNGYAKPTHTWRLIVLSAGEESLSGLMERGGRRSSAGQEIRLAEIDADAGSSMGIFDQIHGFRTAAEFAAAVNEAAMADYGTVGQDWIGNLVANQFALKERLPQAMRLFVKSTVPEGAQGQIERVAQRFACIACAGELATEAGLTGWNSGDATNAIKACFASWLASFGGTENQEYRTIIANARHVIETHGASRFEDINGHDHQRINNRVGFSRIATDGQQEFLFPPETFAEHIRQGFKNRTVVDALKSAGMLVPAADGTPTQVVRLPGMSTCRVYVLRYSQACNSL